MCECFILILCRLAFNEAYRNTEKIIENIHLCVLCSVTSEHTPTSNTKCIYRAITKKEEH